MQDAEQAVSDAENVFKMHAKGAQAHTLKALHLGMQAILRSRLESLWHLLVALPAGAAASGADVPSDLDSSLRWEGLETLASIPCQSGMLVRIKHRQMVVVLPPEAEHICKKLPHESDVDRDLPNQMSHAPSNTWTVSMLRVGRAPLENALGLDACGLAQVQDAASIHEDSQDAEHQVASFDGQLAGMLNTTCHLHLACLINGFACCCPYVLLFPAMCKSILS